MLRARIVLMFVQTIRICLLFAVIYQTDNPIKIRQKSQHMNLHAIHKCIQSLLAVHTCTIFDGLHSSYHCC